MFSRFELAKGGHLYVRTADIHFFSTVEDRTMLTWEAVGHEYTQAIAGTADENMARLRQEETEMLVAAEKLRQRQASGYPAVPVARGRK